MSKTRRGPGPAVAAAALAAWAPWAAAAQHTLQITTESQAAAWQVSAKGQSGPAQQLAPYPAYISVSSNGDGMGTTFVPGFNAEQWDGVWSATYSFALPADATDIRLRIDRLEADDKVVLRLNGAAVDGAAYVVSNSVGPGSFNFGAGETAFDFPGLSLPLDVQAGFLPGAVNTLTLFVNNTGSTSVEAPSGPLSFSIDGTTATFAGELRYVTGVPEPSTAALFLAAAAGLAARQWQRNGRAAR